MKNKLKIKVENGNLILTRKGHKKEEIRTIPLIQIQGYGFHHDKTLLLVGSSRNDCEEIELSHKELQKISKVLEKNGFDLGDTDTYWINNKYLIRKV